MGYVARGKILRRKIPAMFSRAFLLVPLGLALLPLAARSAPDEKWIGTWASGQQLTEPKNLPPEPGLAGHTLRQVVRASLGGEQVRVTFSNAFGNGPLVITAATIARSAGGPAVQPDSVRALRFNGTASVVVEAGAVVVSDPVALSVAGDAQLAVTTFFGAMPADLTGHPGSRTTSYIQPGNAVAETSLADTKPAEHWYCLTSIEVTAPPGAAAIVVLGDSITDGRGSTTNRQNRWPDVLSRRLLANPATARIAVLNQGIGGNRVLRAGIGPQALARFERDVLAYAGVRWLVILEGVNDLGIAVAARTKGEPAATAQDLIDGYTQMIHRAHAHGIRVYGATIMPFGGFKAYFTPDSEAARQEVNRWIRTSGAFDGVIDFDAIARDPADPTRLSAATDGGDHLHLSAAGYQLIADAIDLSLFTP
jgi:lysophospholipase L1-like esterase